MNPQEQNELLAKAERDYPAGTEFKSAWVHPMASKGIFTSIGKFIRYDRSDDFQITALTKEGKEVFIFCNGQWAEIVSKPAGFNLFEEFYGKLVKLNDRFESEMVWDKEFAIKNAGKWTPIVINKERPQPLDIENDPRYKDLLDEEAKKRFGDDYVTCCYMADHLSNPENLQDTIYVLKVEKSAQRRYFLELLEEKDRQLLLEKDNYDGIENCLQEANATIEQQGKEIEELKKEPIRLLSTIRGLVIQNGVHHAGDFIDREYLKLVPLTK